MAKVKTRDGAEIFYETRGTGPINLAMLHGWGGVGGLWYQVARALDGHQFCSWLIDLRGHGRSPPPESGYDWENYAADVLAVAADMGAKRFIPVGSSLGGKLAIYLTAKYRAQIPALVLVTPVGPGPSPLEAEKRKEMVRRANDWKELKELIRDWFGPTVPEPTIDACCRAVARTPAKVLEQTAETLLSRNLPEPLDRTDAPTLVVIGERDPHYGPAYQQANVLPFLSRAESVTLPSGHFTPLEQPEELAKLITDFARAHWTQDGAVDTVRA